MTKEEKEWINSIIKLNCIVCLRQGRESPAVVHHIKSGGRRISHLETLPLCPAHHTGPAGNEVSRHPYKARFEARYGTELELLEYTRQLVREK